MSIRYLTYLEIDKQQWDACINRCANGLIYAKSFYLDGMAPNWHALILNDYEAVMPLTWKKKWGIRYLFQPAFMQQGGIFFTKEITAQILAAFLQEAFSHFAFAEITLNYRNVAGSIQNMETSKRTNFLLPLQKTYEEIYREFPSITVKNLKRAKNAGLSYESTTDYLSVLELYKKLYAERLPYFTNSDYDNFSEICKKLSGEKNLVVRNVYNDSRELVAAVILMKDRNRLYNIVSCITKKGKPAQANYFLYNQVIKEFCQTKFVLDFEGSDVKGIAEFYSRFNPESETYPFVKVNNLHPLLKLFKR